MYHGTERKVTGQRKDILTLERLLEKTYISVEGKNLEKIKSLSNAGDSKGLFSNISEAALLKFIILKVDSRLI